MVMLDLRLEAEQVIDRAIRNFDSLLTVAEYDLPVIPSLSDSLWSP